MVVGHEIGWKKFQAGAGQRETDQQELANGTRKAVSVDKKYEESEYVTQGRNRYLYTTHSKCLVAFPGL